MPKSKFVTVYSKRTGRKQRVPRGWLSHPRLGAQFELTPSEQARQDAANDAGDPGEGQGGELPQGDPGDTQTPPTDPPQPRLGPTPDPSKTSDGNTGSSDKTRTPRGRS